MSTTMERSTIDKMASIASEELLQRQRCTAAMLAKRIVFRLAKGEKFTKDMIFWTKGLLAVGLEEYAGFAFAGDDSSLRLRRNNNIDKVVALLQSFIQPWINHGSPVVKIDDCIMGSALINLYRITDDPTLLGGIDKIYRFLLKSNKDTHGTLLYQASRMVYADGVGQASFFLYDYSALTGDEAALHLGENQIELFLRTAMDPESGLCYHAYQISEKHDTERLGVVGWGRAVGWLLLGMCRYKSFRSETDSLLRSVYRYQRKDGLLSWQICGNRGPVDTSATAMVAYSSLLSGARCPNNLQAMLDGIASKVDENGRIQCVHAECGGAGTYPQLFSHYPFGQGVALAALARACRKGMLSVSEGEE